MISLVDILSGKSSTRRLSSSAWRLMESFRQMTAPVLVSLGDALGSIKQLMGNITGDGNALANAFKGLAEIITTTCCFWQLMLEGEAYLTADLRRPGPHRGSAARHSRICHTRR